MQTKRSQSVPGLLSEFIPPFGVVFQVCGHYAKLKGLIVESHIRLTVCEYSPGGDGFRFDSDNLLHDAYSVRNSPVHIGLVPFADHALYLLGEHRAGVSLSLSRVVRYPLHCSEVTAYPFLLPSTNSRCLSQFISPVVFIVHAQVPSLAEYPSSLLAFSFSNRIDEAATQ